MKKVFKKIPYIIISVLIGVTVVYAGSLTPPGAPAKTMKSLSDLYELIETGANTPSTDFNTPGTVSPTMNSLGDTYDLLKSQLDILTSNKIAKDEEVFGRIGTLYGDTDPSEVLNTATYPGTANPGGLTQTGQTTCWDDWGDQIIPCTGTGQDGEYLKGLAPSFVDNSDGTITDNITGLIWSKCSEGQSGTDCSTGVASSLDWMTALSTCESKTMASYTDWRLPNVKELSSITEYKGSPAIDLTFFPNTTATKVWSSTTYSTLGYEGLALYGNFEGGLIGADGKSSTYQARCVR